MDLKQFVRKSLHFMKKHGDIHDSDYAEAALSAIDEEDSKSLGESTQRPASDEAVGKGAAEASNVKDAVKHSQRWKTHADPAHPLKQLLMDLDIAAEEEKEREQHGE